MKTKLVVLTLLLAPLTACLLTLSPVLSASAMTSPAAQPNFSITANPTTLTISASNSATSTITLTSLNGLAGTVNLAATVSPTVPAGPGASLSPGSVTLTSGGSGTSTLTVSTSTTTANGGYTVTVTGTKSSASNSVQIKVFVVGGTVGAQAAPIESFILMLPYTAIAAAALAGTAAYVLAVRRRP